jgi:glyoxylase I family protein
VHAARSAPRNLDREANVLMMARNARYVHTNIVARDWQALAAFYQRVFGCEVVPPERHFAGKTLEAGTGVPGARIDGVHLRLPGHGATGPTLEIFTYASPADEVPSLVHRPGFGHIAFEVESVVGAREEVLRERGRPVGEVVSLTTADGRTVTWCYVTDPEGNIIELQSWALSTGG